MQKIGEKAIHLVSNHGEFFFTVRKLEELKNNVMEKSRHRQEFETVLDKR